MICPEWEPTGPRENPFELLFEVSPDAIVVVDDQGRIVRVNSCFEQTFGWTRDEIQGQPLEVLIPERYRQSHIRYQAHFSGAGVARPMGRGLDLYARRRDGTEFRADISLSPFQVGGAGFVLGVVRDVTERYRMKQAVELARHSLDAAAAPAAPDLGEAVEDIARAVNDCKKTEAALQQQLMRVKLINEITRAIAVRQDLESIFHVVLAHLENDLPTDLASVLLYDAERRTLQVLARGPRGSRVAARLGITSDPVPVDEIGLRPCLEGRTVYRADVLAAADPTPPVLRQAGMRSMVAAPLIVEAQVIGVIVAARNEPNAFSEGEREFLRSLSDHVALAAYHARLHSELRRAYEDLKSTQEQMLQAERLRALGQLASGVAHDINNSLSAIVLFSTLGLRAAGITPELGHCFDNIKKAATDATTTVLRLRDFYRPRAADEIFGSVDVNEVASDVVTLTRSKWKNEAEAEGIIIQVKLRLHAFQRVRGNLSELREVLTNLIFNSVDAMPRGGCIEMETLDADGAVVVGVTDNGIGMDDAVRRRVFEPFFTTKGLKGTGLGLSQCWGIVQRHGGSLEVESAPGRGTRFTVRLPVAQEGEGDRQRRVQPLPAMRILCVDDQELVREGLDKLLTSMGHQVTLAADGREALECFQRGSFDLVLSDLGMPNVNGHELARALKAQQSNLPIVLLTGWGEWHGQPRPEEIDVVVGKPPTVESLTAAMAAALKAVRAKEVQA